MIVQKNNKQFKKSPFWTSMNLKHQKCLKISIYPKVPPKKKATPGPLDASKKSRKCHDRNFRLIASGVLCFQWIPWIMWAARRFAWSSWSNNKRGEKIATGDLICWCFFFLLLYFGRFFLGGFLCARVSHHQFVFSFQLMRWRFRGPKTAPKLFDYWKRGNQPTCSFLAKGPSFLAPDVFFWGRDCLSEKSYQFCFPGVYHQIPPFLMDDVTGDFFSQQTTVAGATHPHAYSPEAYLATPQLLPLPRTWTRMCEGYTPVI